MIWIVLLSAFVSVFLDLVLDRLVSALRASALELAHKPWYLVRVHAADWTSN